MLAFFWNQVVCLSTISGRFSSVRDVSVPCPFILPPDTHTVKGMSFEDIIDWVRPPSPESAAFEKYSIVVQVRPTIAVSAYHRFAPSLKS
jgi:hypothetical protein